MIRRASVSAPPGDQPSRTHQALRGVFESVIDQLPVGVVVHAAPCGRLLTFNKAMLGLNRRPLQPFLALPHLARQYPTRRLDGRPFESDEYAAVRAAHGDRIDQEMVIERNDGTTCIVLDSGTPVYDDRGRILAGLATVREVAPRAEGGGEPDRLLEEARRALYAHQQMIATVAHDLRSPLATLELSASHLLRTVPSGELTRVEAHVRRILRGIRAMDRLTRDLLDFMRTEVQGLALALDEHDGRGLLEEALDMFAPLADDRRIHLRGDVEHLHAELRCDRARVLRVLSNLVGNALKFTRPGGTVAIGGFVEGSQAVIYVADEGPGIDAEDLPHVFDAYWQGKRSRAPSEGVGLGLAIARGIVEAHGGRIWVDSVMGEGATFSFSLPIAGRPGER
jgi:signal transduction histidine kinase